MPTGIPSSFVTIPDGFRQIGVIRDEDRKLKAFLEGVANQMCCEVHIGTLLFSLVHPNTLWWHDASEHHRNGVREEMPKDDFQIRNRPESTQVDLLINQGRWILRTSADTSRKVFDRFNGVIWEQGLGQRSHV